MKSKDKLSPKPRKEAEREILRVYRKFFDGWKYINTKRS